MKKIIRQVACGGLALFLLTAKLNAQTLSSEDIKAQMVKDWERSKAYTIDYLNTMPANKYSYKPVDSIRSFAQQMLHLSQGNVGLMANGSGQPPYAWAGANLEGRASAQTKDSVLYYVTSSYDYCINAVKNSDVKKWGEKIKIFTFEETRFGMMTKTLEHQAHHRGQTTIYIREQGIKPPQERLFN